MKSKRLFASILSAICASAMLMAGCSGSEGSSASVEESSATSSSASSASSEDSEAEERDPVTLTYYYSGAPQPDGQMVYDAMNEILQEKLNVTLEVTPVADDYEQKVQLMINAGEEFDLCFTSSWLLNYVTNSTAGAFADITDMLPEYAPQLYASLEPEWWDAARVNGRIYAVINQQIFARQSGFWYDDKYIQQTGTDVNTLNSLEAFSDYMVMLKETLPAEETTFMTWSLDAMNNIKEMNGWENVSGSDVPGCIMSDGSDTTIFNEYDTPEYKQLIDMAKMFQEKGIIAPDVLTIPSPPRSKLKGAIMNIAPGNDITEARSNNMEKVDLVGVGEPMLTTNNLTSTMTAISATSPNPERALEFLELLNTDKELYNLICHGIEGVHYTLLEDGLHYRTVENTQYNPNGDWMFGCVYNSYIAEGNPDDLWEQTDELNRSAKASVLMGFVFDDSNIKTEQANCAAVISEYKSTFAAGLYGDETDAKYEEFLQELEDAGLEKVLAEKQAQVDAFLASK